MTSNTLPTRSQVGIEETLETLTGYEENDIEARFGHDVNVLVDSKPIMGIRALAYVVTLRVLKAEDVKSPEAKAFSHVMGMTMRQVGEFFPDQAPEIDPDEPVTPAGEGDSSAD